LSIIQLLFTPRESATGFHQIGSLMGPMTILNFALKTKNSEPLYQELNPGCPFCNWMFRNMTAKQKAGEGGNFVPVLN
jgi:hypothetical protein